MTATKTTRRAKIARAAFDATEGLGLKRLRASPKAKAIRNSVLADQHQARRSARARIEAAKDAPPAARQAATDAPAPPTAPSAPAHSECPPTARPAAPAKPAIEPTEIAADIGPKMKGMSAKTATAFVESTATITSTSAFREPGCDG
jgi:hypothetical protein